SHRLLTGDLRAVYHGSSDRLTAGIDAHVHEPRRGLDAYNAPAEVPLPRARDPASGTRIYGTKDRALWLTRLPDCGARFRAETLYAELDVLRELRPKARHLMVVEARRDPAWEILQSIPFF